MTPSTIARGPRGSYVPGRGDITGQQYVASADEKILREAAMRNSRNALQDGSRLVLVDVPGGRSFLVPAEAHRQIVADVEERQARGEVL